MSTSSNFRQAIQDTQGLPIVGRNVIANALPYVGGGLVLTAIGTYAGLGMMRSPNFLPLFIGALVGEIALFFIARSAAESTNNKLALPLLVLYSLLSGFTLSGIVFVALGTSGVGLTGIGISAISCGITFFVARNIGSNLSDADGWALAKTVQIGLIALLIVLVVQLLCHLFGFYTPSFLEVAISGVGVFLFMGCAVVDFYILPRAYRDEQYLAAALSMYLTYINLFVFILRLLIALNRRN